MKKEEKNHPKTYHSEIISVNTWQNTMLDFSPHIYTHMNSVHMVLTSITACQMTFLNMFFFQQCTVIIFFLSMWMYIIISIAMVYH